MRISKFLLLCGIVPWALPAFPGVVSGSVATVAEVSATCQLNGGSIDFGVYDPLVANATTPLQSSGTFSIACTKGTSAVISISSGQNNSHAVGTSRAMAAGDNFLSYELYTSPSHSTVWSTLNTVSYVSTSKSSRNNQSVWGIIPPGQNVEGGVVYSDIVTVNTDF